MLSFICKQVGDMNLLYVEICITYNCVLKCMCLYMMLCM